MTDLGLLEKYDLSLNRLGQKIGTTNPAYRYLLVTVPVRTSLPCEYRRIADSGTRPYALYAKREPEDGVRGAVAAPSPQGVRP